MSLLTRIEEDMIKALKSGDSIALNTLRGLKSEIRYFQIEQKSRESSDEQLTAVISTAAKKRRDSIEQFKSAGRQDLVDKESKELEIILGYLPQQLSASEIEAFVKEAMAESGASSPADLGKVMKILMPKTRGKADGKLVNEIVVRLLSEK
jgi:uncharacterized protein YqeY